MLNFLARDIVSRLHHCGSMVSEDHLSLVVADLREIAALDLATLKPAAEARKAEVLSSYGVLDPLPQNKPFAFAEGKAIIPIQGILVNRMSWGSSYATGYNFIRSQFQAALADPDVNGIIFDVNSYGGIAAGCGELADEIFAARGEKPSIAVVDSKAYSAAMYLAAAASKVVVTPSGGVGSIGCVSIHADLSQMLENEGVKITIIRGGKLKIDDNPFEQLSARAQAAIQRDVDYHYGLFTDAVAKYRGLPVEEVRGTEAACFLPPDALELGLIDAVAMPANILAGFDDYCGDGSGTEASRQPESNAGAIEMDEVQIRALVQSETKSAVTDALTAERTRQSGIRTSDEAKGREKLADHLATNTEMTVDTARAVLAAAPKEQPMQSTGTTRTGGNPLDAAMNHGPNPNIGPDAGGNTPEAEDTPEARATRIIGTFGQATGARIEKGQVLDLRAARAA